MVAAALLVFYFNVSPDSGIMPACIFKKVTGWECPGCGSQRMLHALLHGEVLEACRYNPLIAAVAPLIPVMVWLELTRKSHPRRYARIYNKYTPAIIGAIIVAWTIIRNISGI